MKRTTRTLVIAGLLGLAAGPGWLDAWQTELDRNRLAAAGLDLVESRHLNLVTDARDRQDVAGFTGVFEQAIGQWCEYFSIDPDTVAGWKMTGCVMVDASRFDRAGLIPDTLPPFPAGFQRGDMLWLYTQPGDYYTRHLLLHEGTHAFMQHFLGDFGPPWYAEGMAELLGVHRWQDGRLSIRHAVTRREQVPWWGRVKLIRDDCQSNRSRTLDEVLELPAGSFRQVNAYAWAWAACEFFDRHPDTREVFRQLPDRVRMEPRQFNRAFRAALRENGIDWRELERDWQWMLEEIDYGYDVAAAVPVDCPTSGTDDSVQVEVAADRGWQATGVRVRAGQTWRLTANGMFRIRDDHQPWACDAGGVTIEYYRGRPLGRLLATVVPDDPGAVPDAAAWIDVGHQAVCRFATDGQLYLRVNESPAGWHDNEGRLSVTIHRDSD